MPYFEYYPAQDGQPSTTELRDASKEEVYEIKHFIPGRIIDEALEDSSGLKQALKDIESIISAENRKFPAAVVGAHMNTGSRLLGMPNKNTATTVINPATNLALSNELSDEPGDFSVDCVFVFEPIDVLAITKDEEAGRQSKKEEVIMLARQVEPGRRGIDTPCMEHVSLGFESFDDTARYQPLLTVLNPNHPIRQAIAAKRATQTQA